VKLEGLVAELDRLASNPAVYISSAEENLADMGILPPAPEADDAEKLAYMIELRQMIRSCYGA